MRDHRGRLNLILFTEERYRADAVLDELLAGFRNRSVPAGILCVKMRVDNPANRLIGQPGHQVLDGGDGLVRHRERSRIDEQHALVAHLQSNIARSRADQHVDLRFFRSLDEQGLHGIVG